MFLSVLWDRFLPFKIWCPFYYYPSSRRRRSGQIYIISLRSTARIKWGQLCFGRTYTEIGFKRAHKHMKLQLHNSSMCLVNRKRQLHCIETKCVSFSFWFFCFIRPIFFSSSCFVLLNRTVFSWIFLLNFEWKVYETNRTEYFCLFSKRRTERSENFSLHVRERSVWVVITRTSPKLKEAVRWKKIALSVHCIVFLIFHSLNFK